MIEHICSGVHELTNQSGVRKWEESEKTDVFKACKTFLQVAKNKMTNLRMSIIFLL